MRAAIIILLSARTILTASPELLARATALYRQTHYNESLRLIGQENAPDAELLLLAGKNRFSLGEYNKAIEAFERSASLAANASEAQLWIGRAWGRRAETSNSPMAVIYASRTRQAFEKAVALDPGNREARNDLFDFYLNAPGIMGGGLDKAEAAAKSIANERPPEYEFEEAEIAEKRGDLRAAEDHFRRAMALRPAEPGRVVDLAKFLVRRGRFEESDRLFDQARKLGPDKPSVAFAQAKANIDHHRNTDLARTLLEEYVKADLTPDDPPRQEAEKMLASIPRK